MAMIIEWLPEGEVPDEPGWYWCQIAPGYEPEPVFLAGCMIDAWKRFPGESMWSVATIYKPERPERG